MQKHRHCQLMTPQVRARTYQIRQLLGMEETLVLTLILIMILLKPARQTQKHMTKKLKMVPMVLQPKPEKSKEKTHQDGLQIKN